MTNDSSDAQQQTVSCILHLDPADDSGDQSQADDCDCYNQEECENAPNQVSTNYRYNPSHDAVLVIGMTSGNPLTRRHFRAVTLTPDSG